MTTPAATSTRDAGTPTGDVRVDIVGPEQLASLRSTWEHLFASAPHEPSTSYEWTAAMLAHHVAPGDRVALLHATRGERTVGLAPLVLKQVSVLGQRVALLAPLSDEYNTHSDWLLAERTPTVVEGMLEGLLRLDTPWDCFRMARLLEGNDLTSLLEQALTRRRLPHWRRRGDASYFLPLPRTFDAYLAARSSKFRNFLKRAERRLSALGRWQVHELSDPSSFDAAYERLLLVEEASWKHGHGTAVTAVPRQVGFYGDMGRGASEAGRLHLQWLTLDDAPIAYNLGYLCGGRYSYLKTSFTEAHKAASPATVLRAHLIEGLIARGTSTFDFPGAPYEWERQWTDEVRWHDVLTVYSGSLRSRGLELLERVRHAHDRNDVVRHLDARAQKAPGSSR